MRAAPPRLPPQLILDFKDVFGRDFWQVSKWLEPKPLTNICVRCGAIWHKPEGQESIAKAWCPDCEQT